MFPAWLGQLGSFLGGVGQAAGGVAGLFGRGGGGGGTDASFYQNWRNDDMAFAREQFEWSKELARSGLSMRMADAKAAGIHPLFAVGAGAPSAGGSISVNSAAPPGLYDAGARDADVGAGLANMGQGLGRALQATMNKQDREAEAHQAVMRKLGVEGQQLDNDYKRMLIASEIARQSRTSAQVGPPFPGPSRFGVSEMKPNEVTTTQPGAPFAAAGPPQPSAEFQTMPSGAVMASPAQHLNIDEMSTPGYLTWMYENRVLPFFNNTFRNGKDKAQNAAPPKSMLPPGADRWHFAFPGRWVPHYPEELSPRRGHLTQPGSHYLNRR